MDKDILKKAVELADGWEWAGLQSTFAGTNAVFIKTSFGFLSVSLAQFIEHPAYKDALAAQLVRQYYEHCPGDPLFYEYDAMDLLKYIVKPKALEKGEGK